MSQMDFRYGRVYLTEASRECRRACRAAQSDESDSTAEGPAIAAIILSEASLETFMSEALALLEKQGNISHHERTSVEDRRKF